MDTALLAAVIAFIITYAAIPVIIRVAEFKKLYDVPDDRKIHVTPIPSLGGLGITAGFIIACLMAIPFYQQPSFQYFLAASMVIFFLGLKDDILVIGPLKKFIGQLIAAFIIVYKGGIQITSMYGFLGVYEMPDFLSLALTYFTILVIINSFNLIDGVDGLAGGLGLMTSLVFGLYFLFSNDFAYATFALSLSGALFAFLIFNRSPAKIFMGDTGSMLLGLASAVMVIHFIAEAGRPDSAIPLASAPALGYAILLVPLFDTLRVFTLRILRRRSPFSPDRGHVHHFLLDLGNSHNIVSLSLIMVNMAIILFAYLLRDLGPTILIIGLTVLASLGILALYILRKKTKVSNGLYSMEGTSDFSFFRSRSTVVTIGKITQVPEQN